MEQQATAEISYFICSLPRSGSSLLSGTLRRTGIAGRPADYFFEGSRPRWIQEWGIDDKYESYVKVLLQYATTPNRVFGSKIMYPPMRKLLVKLRRESGDETISELDMLGKFFPNLRFLHITRQNKVRQAISLTRAVQTQLWSTAQAEKVGKSLADVEYNYEQIKFYRDAVLGKEAKWQAFFQRNNIEPYHITYEDFVADFDVAVIDILTYLGIAIPDDFSLAVPVLKKQADAITEEWIQRFEEEHTQRGEPEQG